LCITLDFLGSGEPSSRSGEDPCDEVAILSRELPPTARLYNEGSAMDISYELSGRRADLYTREEKA
jgi:hypothetical protein